MNLTRQKLAILGSLLLAGYLVFCCFGYMVGRGAAPEQASPQVDAAPTWPPTWTPTPRPTDTPTLQPTDTPTPPPAPSETPIPTDTPMPPPPPPTDTPIPPTDTPAPPEPEPTKPVAPPPQTGAQVIIKYVFYDGVVYRVESDEYAEIANVGTAPVDLGGWLLNAGDRGQDFVFPGFVLGPGQACRVYTNEYHPNSCGFSFGSSRAIWNNKGDCGYLYNANRELVSTYCY